MIKFQAGITSWYMPQVLITASCVDGSFFTSIQFFRFCASKTFLRSLVVTCTHGSIAVLQVLTQLCSNAWWPLTSVTTMHQVPTTRDIASSSAPLVSETPHSIYVMSKTDNRGAPLTCSALPGSVCRGAESRAGCSAGIARPETSIFTNQVQMRHLGRMYVSAHHIGHMYKG